MILRTPCFIKKQPGTSWTWIKICTETDNYTSSLMLMNDEDHSSDDERARHPYSTAANSSNMPQPFRVKQTTWAYVTGIIITS